jgi:O-glycosyl hydrolase
MHHALNELNVSIVRAQGEVSPRGVSDHNREVLQRAMKINPQLQILLTFWQPRSLKLLKKSDWLDIIEGNQGNQYSLRKSMEDSWADEIVHRTKQYLDWGIRVTTLGVQNETNYSKVGGQTCIWDPYRLRDFIEQKLKPRLDRADIKVKIAAPDLAFIGYKGSELSRFLPITCMTVTRRGWMGVLPSLLKIAEGLDKSENKNFPGKNFG